MIVTGSIAFWVLFLVELVCLVLCMTDDDGSDGKPDDGIPRGFIATFTFLLWLALLFTFGDWSLKGAFTWAGANWLWALTCFGSYLTIGTVWSFLKVWLVSYKRGAPYRDAREKWLRDRGVHNGSKVPVELREEWQKFVKGTWDHSLEVSAKKPVFSEQKARIGRHLAYWPISILYSLISDLFVETVDLIILQLRKVYEKIINFAYRDILDDMQPVAEQPTGADQ